MSEENARNIGSFKVSFDKEINAKAVIAFLVFFWAVAAGWAGLKNQINRIEDDQTRIERVQADVKHNYVTKEQLNYIVIERLDRLEKQLEDQLNRIEDKINE